MKINQIKVYPLAMPLNRQFKTAHDQTEVRVLTLLEIELMNGVRGYGEIQSFTNTNYAAESQAMSRAILPELSEALKQLDWDHPHQVAEFLAARTHLSFVRAALEMACWDAFGKVTNQSLATMLGATQTQVPVSVAIGIQTTQRQLEIAIEQALKAGYRRIKLKANSDLSLPDVRRLKQDNPEVIFSVDLNNGLSDTDADIERLIQIQQQGITLVEEPIQGAPWQRYGALKQTGKVPLISLDESINSLVDVKKALELDVADAYTLKQGKLGGITETALAICAIDRADRLPWVGGMLSSGLGRSVDLALAATLKTPMFPADISATTDYVAQDIIYEALVLKHGEMTVPQAAGIGVTMNWHAITHFQQEPVITY